MNEILNEVSQKLSEVFDPGSIGALLAQGIINLFLLIAVFTAFYVFWKDIYFILQPIFRKSKMDKTTTVFTNSTIRGLQPLESG